MDDLIDAIEEARDRLRAAFQAAGGKPDVQAKIQAELQQLADLQGQIELQQLMNAAEGITKLVAVLDAAIAAIRNDISRFLLGDLERLRERLQPGNQPQAPGFPAVEGGMGMNTPVPTPGGDGPGGPGVGWGQTLAAPPLADPNQPVLMLAPPGTRRVNGPAVIAMQMALSRAGQVIEPDGDFGGITAGALQRWQAANGLPTSNTITAEQWVRLTGSNPPTLFDLCLGVTSDFEGTKFDRIVGNFDGAGVTFGLIGFTLANGELKALLSAIEALKPGVIAAAFGALYGELLRVLDLPPDLKIRWADSVSLGQSKTEVVDTWKKAFMRLGSSPYARKAQMERAWSVYWSAAKRYIRAFTPSGTTATDLDAALWYDTAVQNNLSAEEQRRLTTISRSGAGRRARCEQFAATIAAGSNPRWAEDVRTRKLTFSTGSGSVHGSSYSLSQWGFSERPVTDAELEAPSTIAALVSEAAPTSDSVLEPDAEARESSSLEAVADVLPNTARFGGPHANWANYDRFAQLVATAGLRNITVDELLFQGAQNETGECSGRNTYPPEDLWRNILPTAAILDRLRSDLGAPIRLISLYRSLRYNSCIQGSASNSFHMQYKAIDFIMETGSPAVWSARLKQYRAAGMFKGGIGVYRTFVHVDTRGSNADWTG